MVEAQSDAGQVSQADRPVGSRRREGPPVDRAGIFAPDLRCQRHHRRLYRRRLQDGDSGGSLGQGFVPPGGGAGARQDPQGVSRLRHRAAAGGLQGRIRRPFQRAGDCARLEHEAARCREARPDRRVGQGSAADRLRRIDPDRGGFQAHAWPRHRAGGLWPRGRQHPFAEREV